MTFPPSVRNPVRVSFDTRSPKPFKDEARLSTAAQLEYGDTRASWGIVRAMPRLDAALRGPHLRLPRPLDACSDWWADRPPRVRVVLGCLLLVAAALGVDARIRGVESHWGGSLQRVAVA